MQVLGIHKKDSDKEEDLYYIIFIDNGDGMVVENMATESPVKVTQYDFEDDFTADDLYKAMSERNGWDAE